MVSLGVRTLDNIAELDVVETMDVMELGDKTALDVGKWLGIVPANGKAACGVGTWKFDEIILVALQSTKSWKLDGTSEKSQLRSAFMLGVSINVTFKDSKVAWLQKGMVEKKVLCRKKIDTQKVGVLTFCIACREALE